MIDVNHVSYDAVVFTETVALVEARLPAGLRLYVVGDIHGRNDLLRKLIDAIERDIDFVPPTQVRYVFLGDYIDRGPHAYDVLETLIELTRHRDVWFLRGNHESCLLDFLEGRLPLESWKLFGGASTLISYGIDPGIRASGADESAVRAQFASAVPLVHHVFLRALRPYVACGDYFFVHAGIRPGTPIGDQAESDLLWIRQEFLDCEALYEKVIIHGHSPNRSPEVKLNRINLDTGAYATGVLTSLRIDRDEQSFIEA